MDFSKIDTAELEAELARRQPPRETWVEFHIRVVNDELAHRELGFDDLAKMTNPPMQVYHISQILRSEKICRMDIFERLIEALRLHPYRGESDDS